MNRRLVVAFLAGVGLAGVFLAVLAALHGDEDATAPTFEAVSFPGGDPVAVDVFDGTPVLLAGWATWCAPCERELPALQEFSATGDADGIEIVLVNVDAGSTPDDALVEMLDRLDVTLPVWRDDGDFLVTYGGTLMPFSVLLDADGSVVRSWTGMIDLDSDDSRAAFDATRS